MSLLQNTFVTFQHHIITWVAYFIHLFLILYWQVNDAFCWLLTAQYDVTASCMQRNQNFIFELNILRCCGYQFAFSLHFVRWKDKLHHFIQFLVSLKATVKVSSQGSLLCFDLCLITSNTFIYCWKRFFAVLGYPPL